MFIFYYAVLSEVSPPTPFRRSPPPPSPAAIPTRPRFNPGNTPCRRFCPFVSCSIRGCRPLAGDPEAGRGRYRRNHDQTTFGCSRWPPSAQNWALNKIPPIEAACFCYGVAAGFPSLIERHRIGHRP